MGVGYNICQPCHLLGGVARWAKCEAGTLLIQFRFDYDVG